MERLYPYHIFYIKTDCTKDDIGAVLMKGDDSVEARKEYAQEKSGENCEFDKSLEGMRLRQISFILISMVSSLENSRNNFVGEPDIVRWAIVNVRNYMLGEESTVISDCSGLKKASDQRPMYPKC